jgi:hypothetical protein
VWGSSVAFDEVQSNQHAGVCGMNPSQGGFGVWAQSNDIALNAKGDATAGYFEAAGSGGTGWAIQATCKGEHYTRFAASRWSWDANTGRKYWSNSQWLGFDRIIRSKRSETGILGKECRPWIAIR